jgi:hypothetical protein
MVRKLDIQNRLENAHLVVPFDQRAREFEISRIVWNTPQSQERLAPHLVFI